MRSFKIARSLSTASNIRLDASPLTLNNLWWTRSSDTKSANQNGFSDEQARMNAVRQAFVLRSRHYMGCLYRKGAQIRKGQVVGNGAKDSDLYLDCCGLVRRCVQDMKLDFGFELGPWNQGYLFDTLPVKVAARDLLAGDLIFSQGRYRDPKWRRMHHDIVHVEIFVGGRSGQSKRPACARPAADRPFRRRHHRRSGPRRRSRRARQLEVREQRLRC